MTGALADWLGGAASTGSEPLQDWASFDQCPRNDKTVRGQIVIVLRVGDRRLQSLCNQAGGFPRDDLKEAQS